MKRNSMFALLLMVLCAAAVQAQVTAIKAGRLIDTKNGTVSTNQVILVEGSKINAAGSSRAEPEFGDGLLGSGGHDCFWSRSVSADWSGHFSRLHGDHRAYRRPSFLFVGSISESMALLDFTINPAIGTAKERTDRLWREPRQTEPFA